MRDDLDLSQVRTSRIPRLVAIASALGIILIAAWVFAPILMAKYARATATVAAGPKSDTATQPASVAVVAGPSAAAIPASPAAPAANQAAPPAPITTAVAAGGDDNAQPPAAAPAGADNNTASPWPKDAPVWPRDQAAQAPPAQPPQAAMPPPASANNMQLASVPPAETNTNSATAADVGPPANVPLPRSRPSKLIAARLAIPLPRPRPDIGDDTPTPSMRAFELQVERMR